MHDDVAWSIRCRLSCTMCVLDGRACNVESLADYPFQYRDIIHAVLHAHIENTDAEALVCSLFCLPFPLQCDHFEFQFHFICLMHIVMQARCISYCCQHVVHDIGT